MSRSGLSKYHQKRDLERTPEPGGKKRSGDSSNLIFVVQRHKASRLHYDLRLEMDGVLKSWAVPKGPSLDPKDKRLAMMVEDHPYDYKDFEGVIPEGNYGAGVVEIWDKGTYVPVDPEGKQITAKDSMRDLKKGSIKFKLSGRKLKGEFALVHMVKAEQENAWLLIKHRDGSAVDGYDSEDHVPADSPINKVLKRSRIAKRKSAPAKRAKPKKSK